MRAASRLSRKLKTWYINVHAKAHIHDYKERAVIFDSLATMSRQNTFTVIPRPGQRAADSPVRPMTSKQVRKAYKDSTKTPTMSRAERYKWEKAEQERIRKELEKEKASAKARAARERKKEKEMAVLAEKKRSGAPLVSVRPSQDTIARFVRGNGSGKKRDADGENTSSKRATVAMPGIAETDETDEQRGEIKGDVFDEALEECDLDGDILEELNSLVDEPVEANPQGTVEESKQHNKATMQKEKRNTWPNIQNNDTSETKHDFEEETSKEAPDDAQESAKDSAGTAERKAEESFKLANRRVDALFRFLD